MNRRPKLLIIINIILLAHNVLCNPIENKDATTTIMPSTSHLSDAVNVSNYAPWVLSLSRGRKSKKKNKKKKELLLELLELQMNHS